MPTPEGAFGMGAEIPVAEYARNSTVIALTSTFLSLVFGIMAGYVFCALDRFRPGRMPSSSA